MLLWIFWIVNGFVRLAGGRVGEDEACSLPGGRGGAGDEIASGSMTLIGKRRGLQSAD